MQPNSPKRGLFLLLSLLCAGLGVSNLAAQEVTVPSDGARTFVGNWSVAVEGAGAPVTLQVRISDNDGRLAAGVVGLAGTETPVPTITLSGESLVLAYSTDMEGTAVPIEITLTPEAQTGNLLASIDMAGGMATFAGKGTPAAAQ
jgi:hypothetical protein